MAEEIITRWESLTLTEEEKQEVTLSADEIFSLKIRGSYCLLAMILNDRTANREAFKSTMARVWSTAGWITFKEFGNNRFLLEFQLLADVNKVLQGRPWSFDRHLICLREFEGVLSANEVQFSAEPFWVQLHNLPFAGMTRKMGEEIGSTIGKVHSVETDEQGYGWGNFLRVRVEVNVNKALARGRMLKHGGRQCWVQFKYERLTNFCFKCGHLQHANGKCSSLGSQATEQYGYWLRAAAVFPSFMSVKKYGGRPEQNTPGSPTGNSSQQGNAMGDARESPWPNTREATPDLGLESPTKETRVVHHNSVEQPDTDNNMETEGQDHSISQHTEAQAKTNPPQTLMDPVIERQHLQQKPGKENQQPVRSGGIDHPSMDPSNITPKPSPTPAPRGNTWKRMARGKSSVLSDTTNLSKELSQILTHKRPATENDPLDSNIGQKKRRTKLKPVEFKTQAILVEAAEQLHQHK
ncbi:uncharacterized protein LOC122307436 [Carya illinoinensis]|uniref:uncharacterized protein LOC122307436 n=1 Tax=Carya illinoinensis TaxID=32201 RepID=UPI001C72894A|nr:uncharacterized protein LOC122307436 [Carya illinoinensis]